MISDLIMPNLGGEAMVRRCHEALGQAPVIFMSGYAEQMVAVDTFGGRLVEMLQKPVEPRELVRRVRVLLDRESARSRQNARE